jgi:glycosyltransferase involved in cell wall biosynthesis
MRICYVLLSPTFGMHQYTADLANDRAISDSVHVLTVRTTPRDRFAPQINLQAIADVHGTGLKLSNFNLVGLIKFYRAIVRTQPDVVHFTGPHLWNPILLALLKRAGIPTIHTLHDLDPHSGSGYGRLLYLWNDSIKKLAGHILVHGQAFRARLIAQGVEAERVTYAPLLHLFLNYEADKVVHAESFNHPSSAAPDRPVALFFARLEAYKGVNVLIDAMRQIEPTSNLRAIIAGKGDIEQFVIGPLPGNVEVRNRLIEDQEAIELFKQCSVVVLPYTDATQSAVIAAAYAFRKPVIATDTGALPEYVVEGETGWIIEPRDSPALAECLQLADREPARLTRMGEAGHQWYHAQRIAERRTLRLMYERVGSQGNVTDRQIQRGERERYVDSR